MSVLIRSVEVQAKGFMDPLRKRLQKFSWGVCKALRDPLKDPLRDVLFRFEFVVFVLFVFAEIGFC